MVSFKKFLTPEQRRLSVQRMVERDFPDKLYFICICVNMLVGISIITFQTILALVDGPSHWIPAVYMIGFSMIICESLGSRLMTVRRVRYFEILEIVRFITGLISLPMGLITTSKIKEVYKLMDNENCSPCHGSEYLWLLWVMFVMGSLYGLPHIILGIQFYRLKSKAYRNHYLNNQTFIMEPIDGE